MQLAGKVALITGAGSGIGNAAALLLAKEGAKVAALGRTEDELKETVTQIRDAGGEAIPLSADISQPNEMQQAVQQLVNQWGRLDVVFAMPESTVSGPPWRNWNPRSGIKRSTSIS